MANKTVSRLNILIAASADSALATYRQVESATANLAGSVTSQFGKLATIAGVGAAAYAAFDRVKEGFAANEELAATAREFRALTGSAAKAKELLEGLGGLEAAGALFDLDGNVSAAAKTLARFGVDTSDLVDTVRDLGAISAATGTPLEELAEKFGKLAVGPINLKKLVAAAESGIPLIQQLTAEFGTNEEGLAKLLSQGKVGFEDIRAALDALTSESGEFGDALAQQAESTTGRLQSLERSIGNLGEAFAEALTPLVNEAATQLANFSEALGTSSAETVRGIVEIGLMVAAFAAAVVIVPKVVAGIASIIRTLRALTTASILAQSTNPVQLVATLASLAVGTAAAAALAIEFDNLAEKAEKSAAATTNSAAALQGLAKTQDTTAALEDHAKKLEDLAKRGEAITRANRTPLEILQDDVADLNQLFQVGAINAATYDRAVAAAGKQFQQATEESERLTESVRQLNGVAAAERGTTSGFSAIQSGTRALAALRESDSRELARSSKLQAEILAVLNASKRRLDEIAGKQPVELIRGEL